MRINCDKCGKEIEQSESFYHPSGVHTDDFCEECYNEITKTEKTGRGGAREGAGRPTQGTTKKVSITLTEDVWDFLDEKVKETESNRSAVLRDILINAYEGDIEWFKKVFGVK